MEEQGSYPISDEKRQRLRVGGIVALSRNFISAAILFGFLAVISLIFYKSSSELEEIFTASLDKASRLETTSHINDLLGLTFGFYSALVFKILLILVFFAMLGGLLQTLFLFRPSLIFAPYDKRRPLARRAKFSMRIQNFVSGIIGYVLFCILMLFVATSLFDSLLVSSLTETYNSISGESRLIDAITLLIPKISQYFYWILISALCYTFVVGVISLILVKINFEKTHQMTRSEIDAEIKEHGAAVSGHTGLLEDNG